MMLANVRNTGVSAAVEGGAAADPAASTWNIFQTQQPLLSTVNDQTSIKEIMKASATRR